MTQLYRVADRYYFRLRIPSDLRTWFGNRVYFKRSLHTSDLKNARKLLKAWGYHAEKTFTLMRSGFMTQDKIRQLAEQFFKDTLNEYEERRATGSSFTTRNEDELDGYLCNLGLLGAEFREALAFNKLDQFKETADDLIERNNLTVDREAPWYALLCREMIKQLVRVHEIEERRAVGDYSDDVHLFAASLPSPIQGVTPSPKGDKSPLLSDMIDKFIEDYRRNWRANENSIKEYMSSCKLLQEIIRDKPVATITRDNLREFD